MAKSAQNPEICLKNDLFRLSEICSAQTPKFVKKMAKRAQNPEICLKKRTKMAKRAQNPEICWKKRFI